MIAAVLFDLGDTLIHFEAVDLNAAFALAAQQTHQLLQEKFAGPMPSPQQYRRRQFRALRWAYFKSQITGREFDSTDILRETTRKLGIDVPDDFYDELAWQWYKALADASQTAPDAHATLEELQRRRLRLGIVSNTFVSAISLDRHLQAEGLLRFFPVRVYSCDMGIRKPRREIFHEALDRLGAAAEQTLFVGDNFKIDILGALRAGMYAAHKASMPPRKLADRRAFHIRRLDELPGLIDRINAET